MSTNIGHTTLPRRGPNLDLKRAILDRIKRDKSIGVWTPNDFLDLGARSAIDKALQRLTLSGEAKTAANNAEKTSAGENRRKRRNTPLYQPDPNLRERQ